MNTAIPSLSFRKNIALFLIALFSFSAVSQSYEGLSIGDVKLDRTRKPSAMLMSAGAGSPRSFRRIGGVDFQQVAMPDFNLERQEIKILYNENQSDGRRLTIEINNEEYNPYLADWQLKPIAQFADTEYSALVSLFGQRIDPSNSQIVYHPSMIDNLLGLRILQADILLQDPQNNWRLPTLPSKEEMIGVGESRSITRTNQQDQQIPSQKEEYESIASVIQYLMYNATNESGEFESWILTDLDENIQFGITCDSFYISGSPYFYFHKTNMLDYVQEVGEALKTISNKSELAEEITDHYNLCAAYSDSLAIYNDMSGQIMKKYSDIPPTEVEYQEEELRILRRRILLEENFTSLTDDLFDSIQDDESAEILRKDAQESPLVEISPIKQQQELTHLMRVTFPELFPKINPTVHRAATNTMKYSAFFRYIKENNPASWQAFLKQIETVEYKQPKGVYTPDSIIRTRAPGQ